MLSFVPWLQFSKLQEKVEMAESRVCVLETMIDDLQWDIDKIRKREQRLNRHLADVLERVITKLFEMRARARAVRSSATPVNIFRGNIAERKRGGSLWSLPLPY